MLLCPWVYPKVCRSVYCMDTIYDRESGQLHLKEYDREDGGAVITPCGTVIHAPEGVDDTQRLLLHAAGIKWCNECKRRFYGEES